MKICRFKNAGSEARVGLITENSEIVDLTQVKVESLHSVLEQEKPLEYLKSLDVSKVSRIPLGNVQLLAPLEQQEVWAAGVTYLRSRAARMEESDFSASAYDRVYAAERPELFFKSMAHNVSGPGDDVGIRGDSQWNVPEPELALVLNSKGAIVGFTIGNDMSSRDIEGANLLYLPQAKIYDRSCALGPCIVMGASEDEARTWSIQLKITRNGSSVFAGETSVSKIKRTFEELASWLFRSRKLPHGAILLTGTGVIPPDNFTLKQGDEIAIEISGIGLLKNSVTTV